MTPIYQQPKSNTLADKLREAPLPLPAAARYALQLADALRQAHEQNVIRGALDCEQVVFTPPSIEIRENLSPTTYVAPEVIAGGPADARSDVFVLGCVLYKLLTGRDPFPGNGPDEVRRSILEFEPAPLGAIRGSQGPIRSSQVPGLDRLISQCLAKRPEERLQRMQKVYLELKLLRVGDRSEPSAAEQRERAEAAIRAEISRVESALTARFDSFERSLAEVQSGTADNRTQLQAALEAQNALKTALGTLVESVDAIRESAARVQAGVDEAGRTAARVEAISSQLAGLHEQSRRHSQSIEAIHTTMSQTDDLLERVVEAFDSLQSYVAERPDDRSGAPLA